MTGKNLVFTLNNPSYEPEDFLACVESMADFKYVIFQEERGTSGTLHYQGYAEFARTIRFAAFKRATSEDRLHLERRRGTRDQAIAYASKLETRVRGPWESGVRDRPGPGKRSDLDGAAGFAMTAPTLKQLIEHNPSVYLRYSRGLEKILKVYTPIRREAPVVVLFFGPPGTGKTRTVWDNFDWDTIYAKTSTDNFLDGYDGQDVLLLDDFDGKSSKMPLKEFLAITDRYPVRINVKGSSTMLQATKICVTTNVHPKFWYDYSNRQGEYDCIARRFSQIVWYKSDGSRIHVTRDSFFHPDYYQGREEELFVPLLRDTEIPGCQEEQDMNAPLQCESGERNETL